MNSSNTPKSMNGLRFSLSLTHLLFSSFSSSCFAYRRQRRTENRLRPFVSIKKLRPTLLCLTGGPPSLIRRCTMGAPVGGPPTTSCNCIFFSFVCCEKLGTAAADGFLKFFLKFRGVKDGRRTAAYENSKKNYNRKNKQIQRKRQKQQRKPITSTN